MRLVAPVFVLIVGVSIWYWMSGSRVATIQSSSQGVTTDAPAPAKEVLRTPAGTQADVEESGPPTVVEPDAARDFEVIYTEIITLFSSASSGDSTNLNSEASELFRELLTVAPDAGQRVLAKLAALPRPWVDPGSGPDGQVVSVVCSLILDFNLQQMATAPELLEKRAPLVSAMLTHMPASADHCGLVHRLLVDKDYLGSVHEDQLLETVRMATGELQFLRKPAQELLLTLWRNVGGGSFDQLLRYFEGSHGSSLREAAMLELLGSDRYRRLVVDRLIEGGDISMISRATGFLAEHAPFAEAVELMGALKSSVPNSALSGYSYLATNSAKELNEHYVTLLADNRMPAHREEVVMALGHIAAKKGGVDTARLAFRDDRAPRVKGVALLALVWKVEPAELSRLFDQALTWSADEPDLRDYMAAVLQGAAQRLDANWLDRAARRVLALPGLSSHSRRVVEEIQKQYLPR